MFGGQAHPHLFFAYTMTLFSYTPLILYCGMDRKRNAKTSYIVERREYIVAYRLQESEDSIHPRYGQDQERHGVGKERGHSDNLAYSSKALILFPKALIFSSTPG